MHVLYTLIVSCHWSLW